MYELYINDPEDGDMLDEEDIARLQAMADFISDIIALALRCIVFV